MRVMTFILLLYCLTANAGSKEKVYYNDAPPFRSEVLPGYEEHSVKARLEERDLQPLEGIWYYPDEVMTVVLEQFSSPQYSAKMDYRMVLLSAENKSLLPGTVIGYCSQSAKNDKYRLWVYGEQSGSVLENPQKCVATLSTDGRNMTFTRSEWNLSVRINFARFLPKLFRGVSVVPRKDEEKLPEGFQKIYPNDDDTVKQTRVRYL